MESNNIAAIVTRGRAASPSLLIERLRLQTRPPDHIFVVGPQPDGASAVEKSGPGLTYLNCRGSRAERLNEALMAAGGDHHYLFFFGDDFAPSRFWIEQALVLFESSPDIVGISGRVISAKPGPSACALEAPTLELRQGLSGRHLALRRAAVGAIWYDETLPAGDCLADDDFCARIARRGRVGWSPQMVGVKLDGKNERESGRPIGRSQIVNAAYLARKGSLSLQFSLEYMARNLLSNALRALWPEPNIDRRGRLLGNVQIP